jgi:membrane-bound serine protease (ClpP class)
MRLARGRLAALALLCMLAAAAPVRAQAPDAYLIKIDGAITEAYSKAVQRKLEQAAEEGAEVVILELNTPGGTVQDSMELADYIFGQRDLQIVAYINPQAYSGGTMVALACNEIYIDETVGMMGDVAPVTPTGEIIGEKVQTVIREKMSSYARARGYPEALVRAMVTKETEVWRVQLQDEPEGTYTYYTGAQMNAMGDEEAARIVNKQLVVAAGDLLTMDAQRAVEHGFARASVRDIAALYRELGLEPDGVERLHLSASERLLTWLDMFSPLFIVGGIVLLYIELTQPGFGLPGILGIACFVAFFLIKWTLNYVHMLEIVLFAAGIVLLMAEVLLIPGFGVAGVTGMVLIFVSLVLAFQQFIWPTGGSGEVRTFEYSLLKVTGSFALAGVAILVLARFLPSLPLLSRIVHRHDLAAAHAGELGEARTPGLAGMVGEVGVALTALRPAGRAEFGEWLLDVVTEGDFVEKGARVQVTEVRGNRVVVQPYREA